MVKWPPWMAKRPSTGWWEGGPPIQASRPNKAAGLLDIHGARIPDLTIENIRLTSWEPTSTGVGFLPSVSNGWNGETNKFSCKDLVHHPIETTIYMWMAIGSRVPFGKVKPKWDFHKSGYWLDPNFPWENPRKTNLFLFQMLWIRVETVWPAAGQTRVLWAKFQPCADSCRTWSNSTERIASTRLPVSPLVLAHLPSHLLRQHIRLRQQIRETMVHTLVSPMHRCFLAGIATPPDVRHRHHETQLMKQRSHSAGKHDLTGALEIHQQCLETFLDCSHRPLCMSRRFMRPWCRFLDLKRIMTAPRNKTRYCFFSICCQFNWNNIVTCLPSEFV